MFHGTIFCSHLATIKWLQNYLLPCPFKKLTGWDCPGCGFQRSVVALLQGHINQSIHLYPAAIPVLLIVIFSIFKKHMAIDSNNLIAKSSYTFTGLLIAGSYLIKISHLL